MNLSKCELDAKLSDDQWKKLELLMLGKIGDPGSHARDNRLFIEAVLWFVSDMRAWADLPPKFGRWNAIYMRVRRWHANGHWQQLVENLRDDRDLCMLIGKITAYCDHKERMRVERDARKARRETNRGLHSRPQSGTKDSAVSIEESTSHWLSLIGISDEPIVGK